jgi:hypothetical protein
MLMAGRTVAACLRSVCMSGRNQSLTNWCSLAAAHQHRAVWKYCPCPNFTVQNRNVHKHRLSMVSSGCLQQPRLCHHQCLVVRMPCIWDMLRPLAINTTVNGICLDRKLQNPLLCLAAGKQLTLRPLKLMVRHRSGSLICPQTLQQAAPAAWRLCAPSRQPNAQAALMLISMPLSTPCASLHLDLLLLGLRLGLGDAHLQLAIVHLHQIAGSRQIRADQ